MKLRFKKARYVFVGCSLWALLVSFCSQKQNADEAQAPLPQSNDQPTLTHGMDGISGLSTDAPQSAINGFDNNSILQHSIVVDILSIGSMQQSELQDAQQQAMGSHKTVRHFYRATEHDDTEANCHKELRKRHVKRIASFCRETQGGPTVLAKMSGFFFPSEVLMKKAHPEGWMCAQKRPFGGFWNMVEKFQYRYHQKSSFPDYLFVLDDDTWVNMDLVLNFMKREHPPSRRQVVAGCLLKFRDFDVPYGGYGIIFTRKALLNLLMPLSCPEVTSLGKEGYVARSTPDQDEELFQSVACFRLRQNGIGEKDLFQNGMSVFDVMHTYASQRKFLDADHWERLDDGFCMHSDWFWAYFARYYQLGEPKTVIPATLKGTLRHRTRWSLKDLDRLIPYNHSEAQFGATQRTTTGECNHGIDLGNKGANANSNCGESAHFCHRTTPAHMRFLQTLSASSQHTT